MKYMPRGVDGHVEGLISIPGKKCGISLEN